MPEVVEGVGVDTSWRRWPVKERAEALHRIADCDLKNTVFAPNGRGNHG